jgi:dihydrolipoamide dehydrogenase
LIKAKVELDLTAMMAQKTKVVGELTKGVEFLLKKAKSEAIVGEARITGPGKVEVKGADGKIRNLTCKNIIIATGSEVVPLPGVTIDEKQIVSSTGEGKPKHPVLTKISTHPKMKPTHFRNREPCRLRQFV